MDDNARLVYSTQTGKICRRCGHPRTACRCGHGRRPESAPAPVGRNDGIVRIQREVKGRKGRCASVVYGLNVTRERFDQIARDLKNRCGTGGTVKDGAIVIQGDHRPKIKQVLEGLGFKVKLAGG